MVTLADVRVVTPHRVIKRGWVRLDGDQIQSVGEGDVVRNGKVISLNGAWLLPGFVDVHMHGGGGHDVSRSQGDMLAAADFHLLHGTTRALVSLVTASVDDLCRQLGWVADLRSDQIVGAHLEGPFLSVTRCGAQNPDHMIAPDLPTLRRLIAAARGRLATITIAPELPNALDLIQAAAGEGVVVAIGHSDADYRQAMAGYDAGATLTTHLFNGMPPMHHRSPGVAGAALGSGAYCEVINDGIHVHASLVSLVAAEKGRLVLITDAIEAAGADDGDYVVGGLAVRVQGGQARLASTGALAGSTLTMDRAVRRAVRDCGLSIAEAAAAAATNPARMLGLSGVCGSIRTGLAADFVAMDSELNVLNVMKAGRWISQPS